MSLILSFLVHSRFMKFSCKILTNINNGEIKYQQAMKKIFGELPFISLIFPARRFAPKTIKIFTF